MDLLSLVDVSPAGAESATSGSNAEGDGEVWICIRCLEETTLSSSQPYGRRAFKRSCNSCENTYRAMMACIAKEKKAQVDAGLTGKTFEVGPKAQAWREMSNEEKVALFRREKRHSPGDAHKKRLFDNVCKSIVDERASKRGRHVYDKLVPWSEFLEKETLKGIPLATIEATFGEIAR